VILAINAESAAFADQSIIRKQSIQLSVGDSLIVQSDRSNLQRVFLEGNLSSANLTRPVQYPTNKFALTVFNPGTYEIRFLFDDSNDYKVNLHVQTVDGGVTNSTTYYLSGGPFELDVNAAFVYRPSSHPSIASSLSPWDNFVNWVGKFGQAFPFWVKLLYLALAVQFFGVGGLWIRRQTSRRESSAQRLDLGDKIFLWLDVTYKYLLVSFLAIIMIMGGELLILFLLRFMFLASIELLSLWDLFVAGFAVGVVIITYLVRFTLEKVFDLKPIEDD